MFFTAIPIMLLLVTRGCNCLVLVNQDTGKDNVDCIQGNGTCLTLQYAIDHNKTAIYITSSTLTLWKTIEFRNQDKVWISGNGTEIYCEASHDVVVMFKECSNIIFRDVQFIGCSSRIFYHNYIIRSGLVFLSCINIILDRVTVRESNGFGASLFDSSGHVTLNDSRFINNFLLTTYNSSDGDHIDGGGGLLIYHHIHTTSSDLTGETTGKTTTGKMTGKVLGTYSINRCIFEKNNHSTTDNILLSYGGGMNMILSQSSTHANYDISISNCSFSNNTSVAGGGVAITLYYKSPGNKVLIEGCHFHDNNGANDHRGGGGALKLSVWSDDNIVSVIGTQFISNRARYGGGVSLVCGTYNEKTSQVYFSDCEWRGNYASVSGAVDISPDVKNQDRYDFNTDVTFEDCAIVQNWLEPFVRSITYSQGKGVFLITKLKTTFKGDMKFEGNSNTALYLDSSYITITSRSRIQFVNNTSTSGAGITLMGSSCMHYGDNVAFTFTNNTATFYGGAIYSESHNQHLLFSSHTCIFNPKHKNVENVFFSFVDNEAKSGMGSSMYLTTIKPCRKACQEIMQEERISDPFRNSTCLGNFSFSGVSNGSQISTDVEKFSFDAEPYYLSVIPGFRTGIKLATYDDYNTENTNTTAFYVNLLTTDDSIHINILSNVINDNNITLRGKSEARGTLSISNIRNKGVFTYIDFVLAQCPPGYILEESQCICSVTTSKRYFGIIGCDDKSGLLVFGYWAGYIGNSTPNTLYTATCTTGYCAYYSTKDKTRVTYNGHILQLALTASKEDMETLVCAENRHGALCGRCKKNTSVFYHMQHGFHCQENKYCHLGPLLYISVDLVPMAVVFFVLLIFDISLTSGYAYSIIFMAQQITNLNLFENAPWTDQRYLIDISMAFYNLANLEFLAIKPLSFCLWETAQSMDVLVVKYISISFSVALVCIFVAIMNNCSCQFIKRVFRRRKGERYSVMKGLTAFLVLCYTQTTMITFYILNKAILYGKGMRHEYSVPQFDGESRYLHGDHLKYAIPAIFFMMFVVIPPPLILICDPLFLLLEDKLCMNWTTRPPWTRIRTRFKPLMDAFQHCFKSNMQFYAGLFFLYRVLMLGSLSLSSSASEYHYILESLLILFLTFHSITQPFENPKHNIVASLCFCNLAIINVLTIIIKSVFGVDGYIKGVEVSKWLQVSLLYLPLLIMAAWIVKYGYQKCASRVDKNNDGEESIVIDIFDQNRNYGTN